MYPEGGSQSRWCSGGYTLVVLHRTRLLEAHCLMYKEHSLNANASSFTGEVLCFFFSAVKLDSSICSLFSSIKWITTVAAFFGIINWEAKQELGQSLTSGQTGVASTETRDGSSPTDWGAACGKSCKSSLIWNAGGLCILWFGAYTFTYSVVESRIY